MKIDFKNKRIAIIGEGIEGESSLKFFQKHGADTVVLDKKQGKDYLSGLDKYDLIVRSPGIKISNIKNKISKSSIEITSQTKLFFELCPCEIVGVTGTKGKGTTSSLIYEILKKSGKDVYLVGNIGNAPLDILDKLTPQSIVVSELSSFQLEDLTKSPHVAVLLMVTSEHLAPDKKDLPDQNYHETLEEYIDAKRNILRFQSNKDYAIVNRDYPTSNESDAFTQGKIFQVSREQDVLRDGAFIHDNALWFKRNNEEEFIMETSHVLLPGKHNLENVLSAAAVAKIYGVSNETIISVLESFKGLEHRLELVGEINGACYYDDSFSTIPETAIAAIKAFDHPEILILGGASKKSDFKELGQVISKAGNIKAIIGIGLEWPRIREQISDPKHEMVLVEGAKNMQQIILAASKIAKPGDVVLLSPACSSFDMFKNYKERGNLFKEEVRKLQNP
jgi:UDP-N-acetylmuramoylalanine--D-glutamate ligase